MPSSDLEQIIRGLSPADIVIAELKALLGAPVTQGVFVDIVRVAAPPSPDGRAWTGPKVKESIERLTRKRVLGADAAIKPEWRQPLTLRVLARTGRRRNLGCASQCGAQELARGSALRAVAGAAALQGCRSGSVREAGGARQ